VGLAIRKLGVSERKLQQLDIWVASAKDVGGRVITPLFSSITKNRPERNLQLAMWQIRVGIQ
jgi:hypothetical protein